MAAGPELTGATDVDRFRAFVADAEPLLRRALVAANGTEVGRDATAEALGWAWEHFARIEAMANPTGYLYRVGQTAARRAHRRRAREWTWTVDGLVGLDVGVDPDPSVEPALLAALAALSERQRVSVLLVHGHGHTLAAAAELQGCRVSTVRNHLARGMASLRTALGVPDA